MVKTHPTAHADQAWTKLLTLNLQRVFTLTQLLTPLLTRAASIATDPQALAAGKSDPARVIVSLPLHILPTPPPLHHQRDMVI